MKTCNKKKRETKIKNEFVLKKKLDKNEKTKNKR